MHGFIFIEVERFVNFSLGSGAWLKLLDAAGLAGKSYLNGVDYPDGEVVALVVAASKLTGQPVDAVLFSFGRYLAGDLFKAFRPLVDPQWRTLEFLENVEHTIHKVVRSRARQARPPVITCKRESATEVVIHYASPRKLCHLAKGIIAGVAAHYGDPIEVSEPSCMHQGGIECEIRVKLPKPVEPDIHETQELSLSEVRRRAAEVKPESTLTPVGR